MLLRPWIVHISWIDDSRLFLTLWPASFRLYLFQVAASFCWQFELPWASYHSSVAVGHPWLSCVFFLEPIIHLWQLHTSKTLDCKSFLRRRPSFISVSLARFFPAEPIYLLQVAVSSSWQFELLPTAFYHFSVAHGHPWLFLPWFTHG